MKDFTYIKKLIKQGESESVEFKTSFNDSAIETIVAFSNTSGGNILIGVTDNKEIIGLQIGKETIAKWVNEIKNKTTPPIIIDINLVKIENKIIADIVTPEYPIKPVSFKGKYYKRVTNSNHLLSIDELANEHLKTINSSWDYYPDPNHNIDDISIEKAGRFFEKSGLFKNLELNTVGKLLKLQLIRDNKVTIGAYLLFTNDYCLITDMQVGRFKSPTKIIDSTTINTDLFAEVEQVLAFINKHLMVEYIITGEAQRTERFDYPTEAIREIVIHPVRYMYLVA